MPANALTPPTPTSQQPIPDSCTPNCQSHPPKQDALNSTTDLVRSAVPYSLPAPRFQATLSYPLSHRPQVLGSIKTDGTTRRVHNRRHHCPKHPKWPTTSGPAPKHVPCRLCSKPIPEDRQPRRIRPPAASNQAKLRPWGCNRETARSVSVHCELVWGSVTWVTPTQPGF